MTRYLRGCELLMAALLMTACATSSQRGADIKRDDKAAQINVQLGATYLEQGNLELANTKLERALKQGPNLATAHWVYALLQMRLGRPKLAETHFRNAIDLDPEDSNAHHNYGWFLCNVDRLKEAQVQFDLALDNPLYDQPEKTFTNAGVCALKGADTKKAEEYFRKALDRNPKFPPALYEMARLTYEQELYPQTRAYLERYKEVARHNAGTLWLGVQAERQLGNRNAAGSYGMQLKNMFPGSREAAQLLEMERDGS